CLLRDIDIGPEPTDHIAGLVAEGQSAREEPAIATIATTQRECVLPRCSGFKALLNPMYNPINMFGMVHFLSAPALHFFKRRAGVVVPSFVVPIDPALLVGGPGKLTDVVGQLPKARLAFAQGLFATSQPAAARLRSVI